MIYFEKIAGLFGSHVGEDSPVSVPVGRRLRRDKDRILAIWSARARRLGTASSDANLPVLSDALPSFLDRLIVTLTEGPARSDDQGAGRGGFKADDLPRVIAEFNLLRQVLFEVLEDDGPVPPTARDVLLDALQVGVSEAAAVAAAPKDSERQLASLLETVPHLVWRMNPDAEVESVSRQWDQYTGTSTGHRSLGVEWAAAVHPDDLDAVVREVERAKQDRSSLTILHRIRRADGAYRWNLGHGNPYFDHGTGAFKGWIGTTTDVHEQKVAEDSLRESEARLKALADAVPGGLYVTDPNGALLFQNQRFSQYTGHAPADVETVTTHHRRIVHPEDLERTLATWANALNGRTGFEIEYRLRRHDGEYRWFLSKAHPFTDDAGVVTRWYGTNTEIHDQKMAAVNLRESEERFRELANALPLVVWHARPDTVVDWYNDWWYEYLGLPRGTTWDDELTNPMHPEDREITRARWPETVRLKQPFLMEQRIRRGSDGEYRWHLVRGVPILDQHGEVTKYVGGNTDIHDQKMLAEEVIRAKARLEVERRNFERLFEQSSGFVAMFEGTDFVYGYSNQTNRRILGLDPTGRPLLDVVPDVATSGLLDQLRHVFETGVQQVVHELPLQIDDRLHYFNSTYVAQRDETGRINGVMTWGVDVTGQVRARKDLEDSELRYRQAKVMAEAANAAKSSFLANMSHEIRTPIGVIQGFADILAERGLDDEALGWVQIIRRNTSQLTSLIGEILDLAKVEADQLEVESVLFRLDEVVDDLRATMTFAAAEKGLTLIVEIDPSVPRLISSDPTRLRQILINLVGNAIKFTQAGTVRVAFAHAEDARGADRKLLVTVTDTGLGLSPEQQNKIFDPFVQADNSMTRRFGGTGLGLSISRRLAAALGGTLILAKSEPGVGSTFELTIGLGGVNAGEG